MSTTLTPRTLTVTIPVPLDRALSPNARGHWSERHRATQAARLATDIAMRDAIDLQNPEQCFQFAPWPLTLHWEVGLPKGGRRWDDDNVIASLKSHRDQIAACLAIDDRHFVTGEVRQVRDPDGAGYIRVRIESAAGEQTP